MKKTVFMPVFIAIFALAGAVLRGLNLMHGYEAATNCRSRATRPKWP